MEENKVKQKLMAILRTDCGQADCKDHSGEWLADQILQSPDLRVTLEPEWEVRPAREDIYGRHFKFVVMHRNGQVKESVALFVRQADADTYINSKEPK